MELHFYYDVVCPYAYLASTQVEEVASRAGASVVWHPVLLGGIYRAVGASQNPGGEMPLSKARHNLLDMHRQAERLRVPLSLNPAHPQRSVEAMRLLVATPPAMRGKLSAAIYRHYHVEQGRLDLASLAPIAARFGIDVDCATTAEARQGLFDATAEVVARGAFGVPLFVVGDDMWWGADRLPQVAAALGSSWCPEPLGHGAGGATLEFFHDFASPFSCLAALRVQRLAQEANAKLVYRPMLLGAIFQQIGTPMVPIAVMSTAKRHWMKTDLQRWAQQTEVALRWPSQFPIHTVNALRVSLVQPETVESLYRAAWEADRNIGDPDVLVDVLKQAGFDGVGLLQEAKRPAIKQQLRDSTALALEAQVCGAPAFRVDGGPVFWGQDRMDMVRDALGGWRPQLG